MKKTENYLLIVLGVLVIGSRLSYYVASFFFDKRIEVLKEVSGYLIDIVFIYIVIKYINLLNKDKNG
jgi:hypothetical protein